MVYLAPYPRCKDKPNEDNCSKPMKRVRSFLKNIIDLPFMARYYIQKKMYLEIAITDFCNLDCPLCSQGAQLQKNKMIIRLNELKRLGSFIKPFEFYAIKISGGEPTLHPEFMKICSELKNLFKAHKYILATNGFKLEEFKDHIGLFDRIELAYYPNRNESVCKRISSLNLPNLRSVLRRDYLEMIDIYKEKNLHKKNIYKYCRYARVKKIVDLRIYPCCVIFGQYVRKDMDIDKISVYIDENWRQNLTKIDMDNYCKTCFVEVATKKYYKDRLILFYNNLKSLLLTKN